MNPWLASASIAVLVATVPLAWVLRILRDIPYPVVRSHRRWPDSANLLLIAAVTAIVTAFIRMVYYGPAPEPVGIGFQFLIAGLVYVFAIVLLLRQHAGLYPEYFITVGASGLGLRKTLYRNVVDFGLRAESDREVKLEVAMNSGERLILHLPPHHVQTFRELIENAQPEL
jgi:hypothetical protein